MDVSETARQFETGKLRFHSRFASNMFKVALQCHLAGEFASSAVLCAVVYERVFTTRLVREANREAGLVPSKDNIEEQMQLLQRREKEIIDGKKMRFGMITAELERLEVLTADEKQGYDAFYTELRIPLVHGLGLRLYEQTFDRSPSNPFEIDVDDTMYKIASERLIEKIRSMLQDGPLLKT
jgi:hypothetical protein